MSKQGQDKGAKNHNPNPNPNRNHILDPNPNDEIKIYEIKQCIGCLYYASILKPESRNPTCIGIPRSKSYEVPTSLIRKYDLESTKVARAPNLKEFKYACLGHSKYLMRRGSIDNPDKSTQLPACAGFEVFILRTPSVDRATVMARRQKEGRPTLPPRTPQPTQSRADEYINRFTRNANLVASGVAKNLIRVGQHVKESLYEILNGRSK